MFSLYYLTLSRTCKTMLHITHDNQLASKLPTQLKLGDGRLLGIERQGSAIVINGFSSLVYNFDGVRSSGRLP